MRPCVLAAFVCVSGAHAQVSVAASAADAPIRQACAITLTTPLPTEISQTAAPRRYPICNSYALYDKNDFASARTCAIQERSALLAHVPGSPNVSINPASDDDTPEKIVGGMVVLTELYANGEGVPRNPAVAARFYCEAILKGEVSCAPYYAAADLAMLKRLQQPRPGAGRTLFCPGDYPQTPEGVPQTRYCQQKEEEAHAEMHAGGIQAGYDSAQKDADDADTAITPLLKKLNSHQMAAYDKVAAAMQHFIEVQVTGDYLNMGGYGSGGLYPDEEHAAFESQAIDYLKQTPAVPSSAANKAADDALNKVMPS